MSGLIDLKKHEAQVDIILTKRNLVSVTAQVGLDIDVSGSMQGLFQRGVVQKVVTRILAVATRFDDNGEMDMWSFSNGVDELDPVSADGFEDYVQRAILDNDDIELWGGTNYAPVLQANIDHYLSGAKASSGGVVSAIGRLFGKKPAPVPTDILGGKDPALIIPITDGDNNDPRDTLALLESVKDKPIYVQFVGIGHERFPFLQQVSSKFGNVGFMKVDDIAGISDDVLYDGLITTKMADWMRGQKKSA